MPVIGVDGPLDVSIGHASVRIELRRVQHLLFWHHDRHPLFAHVATNLLNWDQKLLLAYPQEAPGAHNQVPRPTRFSVDVEVLHTSYLLVSVVVDGEPAHVLPTLFEGQLCFPELRPVGARVASSRVV